MKTNTAVLSALVLVPVMTANVLAQEYSAIDQSTYNSLDQNFVWQATIKTWGDLELASATANNGVGLANYAPNTPIPINIAQTNGYITLEDNGPTLKSFIPPANTFITLSAPMSELLIALFSPQYPTYSATVDSISVSIGNGAQISIPFTLDTTSAGWEALEISLPQPTADFSLNLNLNLPVGEQSDFEASDLYVSGLNPAPEPSTIALAGLGVLGFVAYGPARKRFI